MLTIHRLTGTEGVVVSNLTTQTSYFAELRFFLQEEEDRDTFKNSSPYSVAYIIVLEISVRNRHAGFGYESTVFG